ncbi:MAG: ABC transporter substrate-binding protein [Alphaproteobacteria bacterium]|nr:ABC transporter substrate-binding protein [Alphaproteobacteria bacterium]
MIRMVGGLFVGAAILSVAAAFAAEPPTLKVGVLKFGTVNWELDVIRHHGLDKANGMNLEVDGFASNQATKIALQAGEVDMIVSDWLWVTRQRAEGVDWTFIPYSRAVGALVVPQDSPVRSLTDLKDRKIGIAGGPLDKSWLLLRALALKEHGFDLARETEQVFGAPPLLNRQIEEGNIDAVINFWHFIARLEAMGYRRVVGVGDALNRLGVTSDVPMLGYVFSEEWANANKDTVLGFAAASRAAKEILQSSNDEWERLRPKTNAANDQTLAALRDGFRVGIPARWGEVERADSQEVFGILAELGGRKLIGESDELQPGTFWRAVMY